MLSRLRSDFQLGIITFFGAFAAFGILPFAIYRFLTGNVIVGILDSAVVISIFLAVIYAWRSGDARRPGLFLLVINTCGTVAVASILGTNGLFWMYTTLLANFFLVGRTQAAIATSLALAFLALHGGAFETTAQLVSFLITASLVSVFAYIFATRSDSRSAMLEALSTRDPLTGVENRRAMEQELQMAVEVFKRTRTTFGLVMLDLDHFKRVNDQHGHDAGDRVLIDFAQLIRTSTRKVDRLFRFGGEEFLLLLPSIDVPGLERVTGKLLARIGDELRAPGGAVTASLGAALLGPGESWPSWLARADAALYRAKEQGRNQAIVDRSEEARQAAP